MIKHLNHYHPEWFIGVETFEGNHSMLWDVADDVHLMQHPFDFRTTYDKVIYFQWERPTKCWERNPSTKVAECIDRYFPEIEPIESLFRYTIKPRDEAKQKVDRYIKEELGGQPYALIHYEGTASREQKDLDHYEANVLCATAATEGLIPIILDWRKSSPLPDGQNILCPGSGHFLWDGKNHSDGGTLAALIDRANVFFGIDSGPGHIAGATNTDTFIFWWEHHPIYFYDLADNVTHCIHDASRQWAAESTIKYFEEKYKHNYYGNDLTSYIEWIFSQLTDEEIANSPEDSTICLGE